MEAGMTAPFSTLSFFSPALARAAIPFYHGVFNPL
jgi:hypothetical protein